MKGRGRGRGSRDEKRTSDSQRPRGPKFAQGLRRRTLLLEGIASLHDAAGTIERLTSLADGLAEGVQSTLHCKEQRSPMSKLETKGRAQRHRTHCLRYQWTKK